MTKVYLGDSVYAEQELSMIRLSTNNGEGDTNIIYLEPEVLEALVRYSKVLAEGPVGQPSTGQS